MNNEAQYQQSYEMFLCLFPAAANEQPNLSFKHRKCNNGFNDLSFVSIITISINNVFIYYVQT